MLNWFIFSRGGNTRKIALAIAEELKINLIDVKNETLDVSSADMLIVGSGTYGSKPGKEMVDYLENLKPVKDKRRLAFRVVLETLQRLLRQ